jgi:hypothetical protein
LISDRLLLESPAASIEPEVFASFFKKKCCLSFFSEKTKHFGKFVWRLAFQSDIRAEAAANGCKLRHRASAGARLGFRKKRSSCRSYTMRSRSR